MQRSVQRGAASAAQGWQSGRALTASPCQQDLALLNVPARKLPRLASPRCRCSFHPFCNSGSRQELLSGRAMTALQLENALTHQLMFNRPARTSCAILQRVPLNRSDLQGTVLDGHKLALQLSMRKGKAAGQDSKAKQEESKEDSKGKGTKLVVRNVAFEATRKDLMALFTPFGQIKSCRLPKKMDGNHRSGTDASDTAFPERNHLHQSPTSARVPLSYSVKGKASSWRDSAVIWEILLGQ